jgi:hypothetical protein
MAGLGGGDVGAAVNQNLLHPDTGPVARLLEPLVVGWLAPVFGMGGGHLVPGSTLANLTALWAARDLAGTRTVVTSTAAHLSIAKAARLLGMELPQIPADERQRIQPRLLPVDLARCAVVLTAGTVATGAVDPLDAGQGAAWRHVDAAWAGPLRLSRHARLLDGIQAADSVTVSAHKWLYQPKECAMVLFADPDAAHQALSFGGGYLAAPNVGLLGSHGTAAAPAGCHPARLGSARPGRTRRSRHAHRGTPGPARRRASPPRIVGPAGHRRGQLAPGRPRPSRGPRPPHGRLGQPRRHRRPTVVPVRGRQPARRPSPRDRPHHRSALTADPIRTASLAPSGATPRTPRRAAKEPVVTETLICTATRLRKPVRAAILNGGSASVLPDLPPHSA